MICCQEHCSRENGVVSAEREGFNVWNECDDAIGQNLERILCQSHPYMSFTNSSVGQVICVKGKLPSQQSVWMELDYDLGVYRVTNGAHTVSNISNR
jgi:hypothetical protein